MKYIPLSGLAGKGLRAIVDDEDYAELSKRKWYLDRGGYAIAGAREKQAVMHRVVAKTPRGMITDHINHDKLDNRKSNLRICDRATNNQNRAKPGHLSCRTRHTKKGTTLSWTAKFQRNYVTYRTKTFRGKNLAEVALQQLLAGNYKGRITEYNLKTKEGKTYDTTERRTQIRGLKRT